MRNNAAMDSMTEIGCVIRELENVSEMLRNESERVRAPCVPSPL